MMQPPPCIYTSLYTVQFISPPSLRERVCHSIGSIPGRRCRERVDRQRNTDGQRERQVVVVVGKNCVCLYKLISEGTLKWSRARTRVCVSVCVCVCVSVCGEKRGEGNVRACVVKKGKESRSVCVMVMEWNSETERAGYSMYVCMCLYVYVYIARYLRARENERARCDIYIYIYIYTSAR